MAGMQSRPKRWLITLGLALAAAWAPPAAAQTPVPPAAIATEEDLRRAISALYDRMRALPYSDHDGRVEVFLSMAELKGGFHGTDSNEYAQALSFVGNELRDAGQWQQAGDYYSRALAIHLARGTPASDDVLYAARNAAAMREAAGDAAAAIAVLAPLLSDPVNDWTARLGDRANWRRDGSLNGSRAAAAAHAEYVNLLLDHGGGDNQSLLRSARNAALAARAIMGSFGYDPLEDAIWRSAIGSSWNFDTAESYRGEHALLLADAAWQARSPDADLRSEVLLALQDASTGAAARSLAEQTARRLANSGGGGPLLARRRELVAAFELAVEQASSVGAESAVIDEAWTRVHALEGQIAALDRQIDDEVPEYFAFLRPRSMELERVQNLLGPGEAALLVVPSERGVHSIAIAAGESAWSFTPMPRDELTRHVTRLLWDVGAAVTVDSETRAEWELEGEGPALPFDRGTAHLLYERLVAPVAPVLAGRRFVYTVTGGALGGLPLSILVTDPPAGEDGDPAALRATSWFGDQAALVQLPSLQSLELVKAIARREATPTGAAGRFLGYGDPVLTGQAMVRGAAGAGRTRGSGVNPGLAQVSTADDGTPLADVEALRALARLPGTARELAALAALYPANASVLRLAGQATETRFKRDDLTKLDVLTLSTHGLLASEALGANLLEPGLVLTPPSKASLADDGLLTAAEIAALTLDARLVILSACNTAASGDSWSGESLSGLARAFLFAGARSLMVSHWYVRDDVAAVLSVRMVEALRKDPALSRPEALQMAMRSVREDPVADGEPGGWSHPSAWAPFTYIGVAD